MVVFLTAGEIVTMETKKRKIQIHYGRHLFLRNEILILWQSLYTCRSRLHIENIFLLHFVYFVIYNAGNFYLQEEKHKQKT